MFIINDQAKACDKHYDHAICMNNINTIVLRKVLQSKALVLVYIIVLVLIQALLISLLIFFPAITLVTTGN